MLLRDAMFSGRARRSEFWYWYLFTVLALVVVVVVIIDNAAGLTLASGVGWVTAIITILLVVPNLAVQVRRLHETSRSGWWWFIGFVPVIGFVVLLYCYLVDSDGDNQYGPYPTG